MSLVCPLQLARLKAMGSELIASVRGSKNKAILLQHTPSPAAGAALCQASDNCICATETGDAHADDCSKEITDKYRVCVAGAEGWWHYGHSYYHVACFSAMVDTETLFDDDVNFFLHFHEEQVWDWPRVYPWGLMIRAWIGGKGHMDLAALDSYISDLVQYRRRKREASLHWSFWQSVPGPNMLENRPPPPLFNEREPNIVNYNLHSNSLVSLYDLIYHLQCSWVDVGV